MRVREDRPFGDGPVQKGSSAMLWRHLCLVRAGLAAGLASGIILIGASTATAQTPAARRSRAVVGPAGLATETVDLLEGRKAGDLDVVARGHGQDRVHLSIHNRSSHRLNVIIPPGLVAASTVGQPGGGGGGGRLQSMGLGSVSNREGAFGEFRGTTSAPAACSRSAARERGHRQPGGRARRRDHRADHSRRLPQLRPAHPDAAQHASGWWTSTNTRSNPRVRKALRSLATYGTSHGVAQAVMWHVCNDLPFEMMAEQTGKVMNVHEIALAARFVEALDAPAAPAIWSTRRLFRSRASSSRCGARARWPPRPSGLRGQLDGLHILGLPLQVVESRRASDRRSAPRSS